MTKNPHNKKVHVAKSAIGYFAFDDSGEIIYFELFERDAKKTAMLLESPVPESFLKNLHGFEAEEDELASKIMASKMRELATDLGFVETGQELNAYLSELGLLMARKSSKKSMTKDRLVIQASNSLQELDKQSNVLLEHLREWFGLYYPELKESNERFIELVTSGANRPEKSTGIELEPDDEEALMKYAVLVKNAFDTKAHIEKYIKSAMHGIAPNTSSLVDPLLAARLLALAGSLERLAKMPSSTIQLLGAEKALFRHIKDKKHVKSPKFGVIYLDKHIQNAPKDRQGKMARIMASKLMIAARVDFYSDKLDENMRKSMEDEMRQHR